MSDVPGGETPPQEEDLIADLARRIETVAEASRQAIAGLEGVMNPTDAGGLLVASVVEQMESLNDECERIHRILARAGSTAPAPGAETLAHGEAAHEPETAEPPGSDSAAPEPVAYPGAAAKRTELEKPPSEGIRLLVTQMAMSGETIPDIERRLRTEFGVTDAHLVIRELFGSQSPAE